MATYTAAIQKLYVGYFNRPADPAGLAFWEAAVTAANGSTAAVSAAFAASAEYKAEYGMFNVTGTLTQIYQNLFGRPPEAAGLAFWVNAVTIGAMTIDQAVVEMPKGAQGADLVTFNNKVLVATAFTAAVDTDAEKAGYAGDLANEAAKKFLATIDTNASATAALEPAALAAAVADVVKASVVFTLDAALAALSAANDAKTEFLVEADGDDDEDTAMTEAELATAVNDAAIAIETAGVVGYELATPGVRSALLADQIAAYAKDLKDAKAAVVTDATANALVPGLTNAMAAYDSAVAATIAADKAVLTTGATLNGLEGSYEAANTAVLTIDPVTGTVADANGDLIVVSGTTIALKLGVTEVTNPGITAILAASKAKVAADKAATAAGTAEAAALVILNRTDVAAAAAVEAQDVADFMTIVPIADGKFATGLQIKTEIAGLAAAAAAALKIWTDAGVNATPAQLAAKDATADAVTDFAALVAAFDAADNANPQYVIWDALNEAVVTASGKVDALAAAVEASAEVNALAAELVALNDAIDAAGETFTDNDFAVPVTLAGFAAGTAETDIFVLGDIDTTIAAFDGDDMLYIGTDYTLNTGKIATAGNNAVLEVFLTQSGADVKVTLETVAFGSNSADAELVITLQGVNLVDVVLKNGIITV